MAQTIAAHIESILSAKSFHRQPETELLGGLARFIPWAMGAYALFKLGDLAVRWPRLNFTEHPEATVGLAVELIFGILMPIVLFSLKSVRRSPGWLLASSLLVVFGVVLNRVNVFIVGYFPPFAAKRYFPAVGELALTIGLVCVLMLLYRFFAVWFPITSGETQPEGAAAAHHRLPHPRAVKPVWAWAFRATAVVFLLGFVVLYSLVHAQAIQQSFQAARGLRVAGLPKPPTIDPSAFKHAERPDAYRSLYVLNNGSLNARIDYYEPVKFTHRTHDVNSGSNCAVCHHRFASGPEDRVGEDLQKLHEAIEVRIAGASCVSCHADLTEKKFQKCSQCHGASNELDFPARIGLKGAYHRQCIGCHQKQPASAKAPTDCASCHHPLVPDHKALVNLPAGTDRTAVTARCLTCHASIGKDILKTAHWTWRGRTPDISGQEHATSLGLRNAIDNYDISLIANPVQTSLFHIGDGRIGENDPAKIDCLVCHDTTSNYRRDPNAAGIDWADVAEKAGRPSRFASSTSGKCPLSAQRSMS